ncbi:hypothetical protein RZO50_03840 [Microbacterium sp. SSW1-59]|uniref:hypothetical protein n=1 Tax=Microbacterium xanthum TaxID=3079794 RepID=UPI002AD419D3|nr:hypothetical protein [Microbacterium sp. SSW1-59]MDZ8200629.1 hypothetical protein [Microbacterium sp. SSW1-59]
MTDTKRLVWNCEHCKKPIADDEGALIIRGREMAKHEKAWAEHDRQQRAELEATGIPRMVPVHELMALPSRVEWRGRHVGCGLNSIGDVYYDIPVGSLRTYFHVVDWTAHLMEKGWLESTDWQRVLRDVTAQMEARS